jgi:aromatic-L-amino-acid decarboxylase
VIWRSLGRAGIIARLREQVRMTNLLASWIKTDDRFELAAPVSMGVVCFRFVGVVVPTRRDDAGPESSTFAKATADRTTPATAERKLDKLNSEIVERINASGRAYLTQTKLRGRTVMRIGLGNVLTTEEHLRNAWEIIRETADAV